MENTNLQKWQPWTGEDAQSDREALNRKGRSIASLADGENVLRILPGLPGKRPFRVVREHYIKGIGDEGGFSFACPRSEKSQPCPVCAQGRKLSRTGNETDAEAAKAY